MIGFFLWTLIFFQGKWIIPVCCKSTPQQWKKEKRKPREWIPVLKETSVLENRKLINCFILHHLLFRNLFMHNFWES